MFLDDISELSFSQVVEAYFDLKRQGISIPIAEFADTFPKHRNDIISRLPAILMLESTIGSRSERAIEPGTTIEGCQVEAEIGRGANAIVYRAYQRDFDRRVAIKMVFNCGEGARRERFRLECLAMARLEHPHIVKPFANTSIGDCECLIMQYIEGFSLEQLIEGECDHVGLEFADRLRKDWNFFAKCMADISDAVALAHSKNVLHRDIKPSNLLMDRKGKVWISDFGLTKVLDHDLSLTAQGQVVGTPRYMAPERDRGTHVYQRDIYSLGRTFYEILARPTGRLNSVRQSCGNVENITQLRPELPRKLARIIHTACHTNPKKRFRCAVELRVALDRFQNGNRSLVQKGVLTHKGQRGTLKPLGFVAICIVCVCVGTQWYHANERKPTTITPARVSTFLDSLSPDQVMDGRELDIQGLDYQTFGGEADLMEKLDLSVEKETTLLILRSMASADSKEVTTLGIEADLSAFHPSPIISAARIRLLTEIVERSSLSLSEKSNAKETMRCLSRFVASSTIDAQSAERLEKRLTFERLMTIGEIRSTYFGDHRIRTWLIHVDHLIEETQIDRIR